jgi:hypothetical protein
LFSYERAISDLDKINIAVIGVLENRGAGKGTEVVDLSAIRKELYSMFLVTGMHQLLI